MAPTVANVGKVKLAKILGMLSATEPNMVLNAVGLALKQYKTLGLSWYDLFGINEKGEELPFTPTHRAKGPPPKDAPNETPQEKPSRKPGNGSRTRESVWPLSDTRFKEPRIRATEKPPKIEEMVRLIRTGRNYRLGLPDSLFLQSIASWNGRLTDKQYRYLHNLYKWCKMRNDLP